VFFANWFTSGFVVVEG